MDNPRFRKVKTVFKVTLGQFHTTAIYLGNGDKETDSRQVVETDSRLAFAQRYCAQPLKKDQDHTRSHISSLYAQIPQMIDNFLFNWKLLGRERTAMRSQICYL